ncbi:transmembrane protein 106B-like isoform X2 [Betta splendens]|uniref:Transmembrane protein 106B-like isoform X2 n=1 Tax=Betta splendens TaxID=158456 RepID=A0A9W2XY56_BETSP|nr:transmembrane protein 106B-like isoform X2 [Betta splendens]
MGAVSSRYAAFGGAGLQSGSDQGDTQPMVKDRAKRPSCTRRHSSGDTVECPTCQGIGRIPRGRESQLVAVIPCTDQRLRPRHTRLYVAGSVGVCLLASALVLFFLFPRAIVLSPVAVKSSIVHFANNSVQINITNVLNITNNNFMEVQAYNFIVQALNDKMVVGKTSIKNMTFVKPLSVQKYPFMISINLKDPGLRKLQSTFHCFSDHSCQI